MTKQISKFQQTQFDEGSDFSQELDPALNINHIKKGSQAQTQSKFVPNSDDKSMSDELEPVLFKEDNEAK